MKDANVLLDEFERQMNLDRLCLSASQLATYKPLHDAAQLQQDVDRLKKLLLENQGELRSERETNDALREQLKAKEDKSLNEEIQYLQKLYQPSKSNYASIGLGIILTGALVVMSQMERVSIVLQQYAPFGRTFISNGLFVCFILFLATLMRKFWEQEYIRRKSEEVCSPKMIDGFLSYLRILRETGKPIDEFTESEAYNFIEGQSTVFKRVVSWAGFQIYHPETVSRLKNIFIQTLLKKKLIKVSGAQLLQRHFSITSTLNRDDYWYDAYAKECEKNERLFNSAKT